MSSVRITTARYRDAPMRGYVGMASEKILDPLVEALALLQSHQDIARFLDDLLTPKEREILNRRWRAILELKRLESEGVSQSNIAKAGPPLPRQSLRELTGF